MAGIALDASASARIRRSIAQALTCAAALGTECRMYLNGEPVERLSHVVRSLERQADTAPDDNLDDIRPDADAIHKLLDGVPDFTDEPNATVVLVRALAVLILTPSTRDYLRTTDPKALEQAREALGLVARCAR